jgi:hypothetical protein
MGPVSKMASVITLQSEFGARFKKDATHKNKVFFVLNRARNSHSTSKWSTQKAFICCEAIFSLWHPLPQLKEERSKLKECLIQEYFIKYWKNLRTQ